ncbi:MAG: cytochrome b N-terminal domain-containing protein [Cyanobacteria bacterium P01_G01_bin.19]
MNSLQFNLKLRRTATILAIAILTLAFIAAISGILIAFYYQPAAGKAYQSLAEIKETIPYGWLIYSLHNLAGNGIIAVSLIQIMVMFLGRQFRRSWFTAWVSGILLTLSTMALGWTAMILAWNQLGFWRLKVELGTIASIPLIGKTLSNILTGGGGINTTTIVHFYTIHSYVLSVVAIALSAIHLIALMIQEREQKGLLLQQLEKLVAPVIPQKQAAKIENSSNKI